MHTDSSVLPDTPVTRWIAAAACYLLPGLGHVLLGERGRGIVIGAGILAIFFGGLLIGGVSVLDAAGPNAPFVKLGQRFLGPALLANTVRVTALTPAEHPDDVAGSPWTIYTPVYGRMEEQGVLYTSIAGFLNLMVMIDLAGGGVARRQRGKPAGANPQAAGASLNPADGASGGGGL